MAFRVSNLIMPCGVDFNSLTIPCYTSEYVEFLSARFETRAMKGVLGYLLCQGERTSLIMRELTNEIA